jgi:hypothetical protein
MSLANATLSNSSAVVFTCANAGGTAIVTMVFTNGDSSARTITVHACPAGEGEVPENMILKTFSIEAGGTYVWNDKLLLANTDTIEAFASTASVVTLTISYLNL